MSVYRTGQNLRQLGMKVLVEGRPCTKKHSQGFQAVLGAWLVYNWWMPLAVDYDKSARELEASQNEDCCCRTPCPHACDLSTSSLAFMIICLSMLLLPYWCSSCCLEQQRRAGTACCSVIKCRMLQCCATSEQHDIISHNIIICVIIQAECTSVHVAKSDLVHSILARPP